MVIGKMVKISSLQVVDFHSKQHDKTFKNVESLANLQIEVIGEDQGQGQREVSIMVTGMASEENGVTLLSEDNVEYFLNGANDLDIDVIIDRKVKIKMENNVVISYHVEDRVGEEGKLLDV